MLGLFKSCVELVSGVRGELGEEGVASPLAIRFVPLFDGATMTSGQASLVLLPIMSVCLLAEEDGEVEKAGVAVVVLFWLFDVAVVVMVTGLGG